jgi:hypothetical protein
VRIDLIALQNVLSECASAGQSGVLLVWGFPAKRIRTQGGGFPGRPGEDGAYLWANRAIRHLENLGVGVGESQPFYVCCTLMVLVEQVQLGTGSIINE